MSDFTLRRRNPSGSIESGDVRTLLPDFRPGERWLFVGPHDDDIVIAGALILQAGAAAGADISCLIVTDGRMGYTTAGQRDDIVAIRRAEAVESFACVHTLCDTRWLEYPDSDLYRNAGRRAVGEPSPGKTIPRGTAPGGPATVFPAAPAPLPDIRAGYSGLQNSFTAELRSTVPRRVFLLSGEDYHPDHKIVHQEFLVSLFHAQGAIWPELGPPVSQLPAVYELAAYHDFTTLPDFEVRSTAEGFDRKLAAIGAYRSQRQIETLVHAIRESGPVEYFRTFPFSFYSPSVYRPLFETDSVEGPNQ